MFLEISMQFENAFNLIVKFSYHSEKVPEVSRILNFFWKHITWYNSNHGFSNVVVAIGWFTYH